MAKHVIQMLPALLEQAEKGLKTETRRTNLKWLKVKKGDTLRVKTSRTGKVVADFIATADARIESLQDMSIHDALCEGIRCPDCGYTSFDAGFNMDHWICVNKWLQERIGKDVGDHSAIKAFAELWNSLNDESGKRYADNPDVAVIQFGKVPNA